MTKDTEKRNITVDRRASGKYHIYVHRRRGVAGSHTGDYPNITDSSIERINYIFNNVYKVPPYSVWFGTFLSSVRFMNI